MDPQAERANYAEAIRRYLADQGIGAFGTAISQREDLDDLGLAKKAMAAVAMKNGEQLDMRTLTEKLRPYLSSGPAQTAPAGDPAVGPAAPQQPIEDPGLLEAVRRRQEMMRELEGY